MKFRILHSISKNERLTTLDFCLSFGRHIPKYLPDASVEYVNPLLCRAREMVRVDVTIVSYELLARRQSFAWPEIQFRLTEFFGKSHRIYVFPQDDYSASDVLDELVWKNQLVVYTPIQNDVERIYRKSQKQNRFETVFTGYFESAARKKPSPVDAGCYDSRSVDLGSRVRRLPSYFGEHGQLKTTLSLRFSDLAEAKGFRVDVSDEDAKVLTGLQWESFLRKLRFSIAAKGGASLTDPSGSVAFWYGRLRSKFELSDSEAFNLSKNRRMLDGDFSAVGPRVIETMANQVGLIQPADDYFHGYEAGEHYLAINPDLSNSEKVLASMSDRDTWVRLVNNSCDFLWSNSELHYSGFIKTFLAKECPPAKVSNIGHTSMSWGPNNRLDTLDHATHNALNQLLRGPRKKAGALEREAEKLLEERGILEPDLVLSDVAEVNAGLKSGEVARSALLNSYLFGLETLL